MWRLSSTFNKSKPAVMQESRFRFGQANWGQGQPKQQRIPLQTISNAVPVPPAPEQFYPAPIPPSVPVQEPHEVFMHAEFPIGSPYDAQDVCEYEHIIYRSMRERETHFPPVVVQQTEVTARHRAYLINWMCRLHYKAQIATEGFYRAVGIVDRAMTQTVMSPNRLAIIGTAAMLIASKIEDVQALSVCDACMIADNMFSPEELKKMEGQLINLIGFDTEFPTPLFFLTIFLKLNGRTQEIMLLARYICELCMISPEFIGVKASAVAAASLMMTRTLIQIEPWTEQLAAYTQYGFEDLCRYCKVIHQMLLDTSCEETSFIRRKYQSEPFCNVASVPVPKELPLPFPYFE